MGSTHATSSRLLRQEPRRSALRESLSPTGELLRALPRLEVDAAGELELSRSSPSVLLSVVENAETCAAAFNLGLSTVGQLLAHAAVQVEDGTIGADSVEALGWLFSELGHATAFCVELAARCRQANAGQEARNG